MNLNNSFSILVIAVIILYIGRHLISKINFFKTIIYLNLCNRGLVLVLITFVLYIYSNINATFRYELNLFSDSCFLH